MKSSKKRFLILVSAIIIASVGTVAANATNASTTLPRQATPAELDSAKKSIQTIGTEFGEFERTTKDISIPAEQVVSDIDSINQDTFKVVTEYGTFIKK
ncbi:hypothetical protein [Tumebacillus permanentifrigoris]|uniref:Uncharacterized protein n=1 Tax=Tumebacillus permanentifrigoris TaxID=378543 RepID=A0A316DCA0_9BACL|nr:hypothetical protein [Tumebacillus permanentifrigoris]PWK15614.1 hypothetical protein C7459_103154 [Tumebacillus permanentifrigoris]